MLANKGIKYFYNLVKRKAIKNTIAVIVKDNDDFTTSHDEVTNELLNFFLVLLGFEQFVEPINVNIFLVGPY